MFLKSKLHQAMITHSELEYEGSCAIDERLLAAAGIVEYEQLHIYNIENGERFSTYAIRAEKDSGIISLNGAAAHKGKPGERVIICTYVGLHPDEMKNYHPVLVYLDPNNQIKNTQNSIQVQVA